MNKDRRSTVIHIALGGSRRTYLSLAVSNPVPYQRQPSTPETVEFRYTVPYRDLVSSLRSGTRRSLTKTLNAIKLRMMIDSKFTLNSCRWKKVQFLKLSTLVNKSQIPPLILSDRILALIYAVGHSRGGNNLGNICIQEKTSRPGIWGDTSSFLWARTASF
jgi:hypothetical protein